ADLLKLDELRAGRLQRVLRLLVLGQRALELGDALPGGLEVRGELGPGLESGVGLCKPRLLGLERGLSGAVPRLRLGHRPRPLLQPGTLLLERLLQTAEQPSVARLQLAWGAVPASRPATC